MELTPEQLSEVNELAKLAFTEEQIALILDVDPNEFTLIANDKSSDLYKAFYGGLLESEVIFRRKVVNLANLGSAPAQKLLKQIMDETNLKRLMDELTREERG